MYSNADMHVCMFISYYYMYICELLFMEQGGERGEQRFEFPYPMNLQLNYLASYFAAPLAQLFPQNPICRLMMHLDVISKLQLQKSEGETGQACTKRKWGQVKEEEDEDLKICLNICEGDYFKEG